MNRLAFFENTRATWLKQRFAHHVGVLGVKSLRQELPMKSMAGVLARIPLFKLYRSFGWPRMLPLNITLSPSPRCNSRCLTCNIWMKRENELTLDEWDKVLRSLGKAPYWFTVSGGEPFMFPGRRRTLPDGLPVLPSRASSTSRPTASCRPSPTRCAASPSRAPRAGSSSTCRWTASARSTTTSAAWPAISRNSRSGSKQLLELRDSLPNLTLGIHSVVSTFSVGHLDEIMEYADQSGVDQFITEIAEPRVELDTVGLPITPDKKSYTQGDQQADRPREQPAVQGHLQDHRGVPRPVLQAGQAHSGRRRSGDSLLRRLGQRPHLRRRHRLAVLRARRQPRQPARPQLRFRRHLVRRKDQGSAAEHRGQGVPLSAGQRLVHEPAARPADAGPRRDEGDAAGATAESRRRQARARSREAAHV